MGSGNGIGLAVISQTSNALTTATFDIVEVNDS